MNSEETLKREEPITDSEIQLPDVESAREIEKNDTSRRKKIAFVMADHHLNVKMHIKID